MLNTVLISGGIALALAAILGLNWIIEAVNLVVHGEHTYEDDDTIVEAGKYLAYLIRHTSYDRDTVIEMTASKFNLDRGIVEWMIA